MCLDQLGSLESLDKVPSCYIDGNACKWGGFTSDKNAVWLSRWKNPINGKPVYTKINRNFDPWVGQNDYGKFEKARDLNSKIDKIRKKYTKDFKKSDKAELLIIKAIIAANSKTKPLAASNLKNHIKGFER